MADIRFYHLTRTPEVQALAQIAAKALPAGGRIVIRCADAARVEALNDALWTYRAESFLPHGSKEDGHADLQPIWLTDGHEAPNGATTLIAACGCTLDDAAAYEVCCILLDGRVETQVEAGRAAWKTYKEAGHVLSYWQQGESGWEKKT